MEIGAPKVPDFLSIDPRVVSQCEQQEDQEAYECFKAKRADEAYMAYLSVAIIRRMPIFEA